MQAVSITLPNNTAYVSGTVNGADYVFALTGSTSSGTVWTADVPRSEDDVYHCIITAVSDVGTSSTVEVTLFYGLLELVTDRTQTDVNRAIDLSQKGLHEMTSEELTEFAAGLKGAYNATDLNRVEAAVGYVANRLAVAGVYPKIYPGLTWSMGDLPVASQMNRYLNNIRILRAALVMPADAPVTPSDLNRLTYQEANDIEKLLLLIDAIITDITLGWMYCGEIYAEEV